MQMHAVRLECALCHSGLGGGDDPDAPVMAACRNTTALYQQIAGLDLTMVKRRLCMAEPEGKGWTEEQGERVEIRYKTFLYLTATITDHPVVPDQEVDAMWHQHILDTRAYMADCQRLFGQYLHHNPYFGMNGEADAANLRDAYERTILATSPCTTFFAA